MNELVYEYTNTNTLGKKPVDAEYSALSGKIETNHKAPKFKVGVRVTITIYKNIFSNGYTKKLVKRNICYWVKDLNGETIIGSFYKKELF